jgi:hypothetical protein
LLFTAPVEGNIKLHVEATGLSNSDRLTITSVAGGTLNNGSIEVACKKGERVTLDVEFDIPYVGPVETSAVVTPIVPGAAG